MRTVLVVVGVLAASGSALAGTLKVPQQFGTIQEAVDAAQPGDTIKVSRGVYGENVIATVDRLRFLGKKAIWDGNTGGSHGASLTAAGNGIVVQGFRFRNGGDQIHITGNDAVVQKNDFRHTWNDNVWISGTGSLVQKNKFYAGYAAIHLVNAAGAVVQKNLIMMTDEYGIYCDGDDGRVLNNRISITGDEGIYYSGNRGLVQGNSIWAAGSFGTYYSGADGVVDGNRTEFTESEGVYHFGLNPTVTNNSVAWTGEDEDGIYVGSSSGGIHTVTGNTVFAAHQDGIRVNNSDGGTISGNLVEESGTEEDHGVYVSGSNNTIADDTVVEQNSHGFRINGNGNSVTNCRIYDAGQVGFLVYGAGNAFTNVGSWGAGGEGSSTTGPTLHSRTPSSRTTGST